MTGLRDPWLIAVWPGMGKVALAAGTYLQEQLRPRLLRELPANGFFDVEKVRVNDGVVLPPRLPRNMLYGWVNPHGGRDLLLFVGEEQPSQRSYAFCQELIDEAQRHGAKRVFTFAAMVTASHPAQPSRIFGVATSAQLLGEVRRHDPSLTNLEQGEITGLNGTLLAAAAQAGLEGIGLLGELPQIARNVPYPKASQAVLSLFTRMAGLELDFTDLVEQATAVERGLVELVQRIQRLVEEQKRRQGGDGDESAAEGDEQEVWLPQPELFADLANEIPAEPQLELDPEDPEGLSASDEQRIERLFERAAEDRSRAVELKEELDRHGVFKRYEDRFLDLFKG